MTERTLPAAEKLAWLRLARSENVGPVTFDRLIRGFGSATAALEALPALARRGGKAEKFRLCSAATAEQEIAAAARIGAVLIARGEPGYPELLSHVEGGPPVITVLGRVALLSKPALGVVGARNASLSGRKIAEDYARRIGAAGYAIVSGLARGIDAAAHRAALVTGTVAVVAGGIDVIYPREHEDLYRRIAAEGAIVAESPLGTEPIARHFPRRNRIISGLSLGVLIIEAAMKSGSLITAMQAAEQGREVFAVPGSVLDPRAEGTNKLIEDGAVMARTVEGVIEKLDSLRSRGALRETPQKPWVSPTLDIFDAGDTDNGARQTVLNLLGPTPVSVDELIRAAQVPAPQVAMILIELELAGRVARHPGNAVSRV